MFVSREREKHLKHHSLFDFMKYLVQMSVFLLLIYYIINVNDLLILLMVNLYYLSLVEIFHLILFFYLQYSNIISYLNNPNRVSL